jgi:hypothetical protein
LPVLPVCELACHFFLTILLFPFKEIESIDQRRSSSAGSRRQDTMAGRLIMPFLPLWMDSPDKEHDLSI